MVKPTQSITAFIFKFLPFHISKSNPTKSPRILLAAFFSFGFGSASFAQTTPASTPPNGSMNNPNGTTTPRGSMSNPNGNTTNPGGSTNNGNGSTTNRDGGMNDRIKMQGAKSKERMTNGRGRMKTKATR